MKISNTILIICSLFFFSSSQISAQDACCGYGSLLQSGLFGGYGFQQYSAAGLNNYLDYYNELTGLNYDEFGTAWGWQIGANIIQIQQLDWLIGVKLYYQSVAETQDQDGYYLGEAATQELELEITSWGFGMSLSYDLNNNFDIRVLDALMTITDVGFTSTIKAPNAPNPDEYLSETGNIGFTADAGLVWYPLPPYVSLEILGGYSWFSMEDVRDDEFEAFPTENEDFIDGGGFFAVAILSVGTTFD